MSSPHSISSNLPKLTTPRLGCFFVPPPNRRTRKCLGGHLKGVLCAPQADYRGPRPVTIIMARTMGTKVRLFGENGKKLAGMPKILQIRDDNLVRDLVRRKTVRVNDDMSSFFVDGLMGGGFACHQLDIRKAALYPLYGLLWHISTLRATKWPCIEVRYAPRARQLGVQPLREFRLAPSRLNLITRHGQFA